jgi:hypothetical protein
MVSEMEQALRVLEGVLAVFGSMKFLHECYEVLHHVVKLFKSR